MKFLLVSDNQQVVNDLVLCLRVRYSQCTIITVGSSEQGVEKIETESPDLVMIDTSLPDMKTVDLIRRIREFSDIPMMILYEMEPSMDLARYLEIGADEYVARSSNPIELLAKVRALLRRTYGTGFSPDHAAVSGGKISIDFTTHEVWISGKQVILTPTEFRMLSELAMNEGRVVTHRRLLEKVWGSAYCDDYSFTKKYVYRLRRKLCDVSNNREIIRTERGVGYKFLASS